MSPYELNIFGRDKLERAFALLGWNKVVLDMDMPSDPNRRIVIAWYNQGQFLFYEHDLSIGLATQLCDMADKFGDEDIYN